jgi:hypothetical protein
MRQRRWLNTDIHLLDAIGATTWREMYGLEALATCGARFFTSPSLYEREVKAIQQ